MIQPAGLGMCFPGIDQRRLNELGLHIVGCIVVRT
jgi:hypothetical protein